jgi:hypothetical protein
MIEFDTGCTCLLRDASPANMPKEWQVPLYGTEAGASLDPLTLYGEAADGLVTDMRPTIPADPKGAHVPAYRHFFECIREGRETESPPERSITTMRILDALYTSAADGGREVQFETSLPKHEIGTSCPPSPVTVQWPRHRNHILARGRPTCELRAKHTQSCAKTRSSTSTRERCAS